MSNIKTYPILYTTDSTGKTRIWRMEQCVESYRTVSGVLDSENLVTSEWTTCEGKNLGKKNETSSSHQAEKEIKAKYKKQLETGYNNSLETADVGTSYVEPMLAKNYKDYVSDIDFKKQSWSLQCKFNGNRCVATKDGLFTRKGKRYMAVPHIERALKEFFEQYPNAVLDGELYNYGLRKKLNELSKLIRRTVNITTDDLNKSEAQVRFYVYDGYGFDNLEQSADYSARKAWIDSKLVGSIKYIEKVESFPIDCDEVLNKQYQRFLDDGEEGGILRKTDEGYEHKRSKNLLKMKPDDDSEGVILNINDGDGNWTEAAATATIVWNGKTFDATFKGEYEQRVEIFKNRREWFGKTVTFLYMGLTGLGIPNYARIDPDNCFKS